jgi:D-glycero-D-manno-heptose 1,7-bisphosphate phosphatase
MKKTFQSTLEQLNLGPYLFHIQEDFEFNGNLKYIEYFVQQLHINNCKAFIIPYIHPDLPSPSSTLNSNAKSTIENNFIRNNLFLNSNLYPLSLGQISHPFKIHIKDQLNGSEIKNQENIFIKALGSFIFHPDFLLQDPLLFLGVPIANNQSQSESKPCLFLDRDGIIIDDVHYLKSVDQIILKKEIIDIIKWAKDHDHYVICLTNQSGISRGYFSKDDYLKVTAHLDSLLKSLNAPVDAWYYSPHQNDHIDRKPNPGLLMRALNDFPIDIFQSMMVGDKESDVLKVPGLTHYLIQGSYHIKNNYKQIWPGEKPTLIFSHHQDLLEFLKNKKVKPL